MAIQIGTKPDSGFDDPIGMLKYLAEEARPSLDIVPTGFGADRLHFERHSYFWLSAERISRLWKPYN